MEKEPVTGFSQEKFDEFEKGHKLFMATLTEQEAKLLTHIHLHGSGHEEDEVENQDQLEKEAKEKLRKAGLDADNYGKYIELTK